MRFTTIFTLMAAGSAIASYQPPAEEDTTTLTSTTTHYITVTKCADGNPDCPHNQPSTSEPYVVPTPEPVPSYEPEPTPEPETSSEIVIVETSSALPEEPSSSSIYYPVPSNSTTYAGPTASESVPVVTSLQTEVVQPSSPPAEEPSQVPESGAVGTSLQRGVLAGMIAVGVAALF